MNSIALINSSSFSWAACLIFLEISKNILLTIEFVKLSTILAFASTSESLAIAFLVSLSLIFSIDTLKLAIISSTSPFIGLFGTVVGILESFAKFASQSKVAFSVIAPAISEALVATAAGILVAIFAYTFHQIISRKIYELNIYLKAESQILIAKG